MSIDQDVTVFKKLVEDYEKGTDVIQESSEVVKRIIESDEVTFNTDNMKPKSVELLRESLKKLNCESLILKAPYAEAIYQDKLNEIDLAESITNKFMILEDDNLIYGFIRFKDKENANTETN